MSEVKFLITLSERGKTLANEAAKIITDCKEVKVTNDEQRGNILELVKRIKGVAKGLEDERMATTRPMDEAKKEVMNLYRQPLDNLTKAESIIKRAVLEYDQEQRRKAEELQAKLRAEAEAKARKERERLEKQAALAVEKGQAEKAEMLLDKADNVVAFVPVVQAVETKTQGVSSRKVWKYRITDANALPREYMIPNEAMLAALARSTQGNIPVPGVEFYAEDLLAVSSR